MYEFLVVDHVNGGGNQHRKMLGILAGSAFYRWIIEAGFPSDLQILCNNCNMAKSSSGSCPHERKRR